MKAWRYSPSSASMICSSSPVPSVATTRAWVSPRVKSAEPWARGRTPTWQSMGRTVLVSRPSMRRPVSRIAPRTISCSSSLNFLPTSSTGRPSATSASAAFAFASASFSVGAVLAVSAQGCRRRQLPGLFRALLGQIDDGADHRLELLEAIGDGAQHDLFGELLGLRFDHQHALGRAGHDEVERRFRQLLLQRVQDILPIDIADAGGADGAEEGNAGDGQRRRGTDHGDDVRIVLQVMAQHRADDLGLVAVAGGEERADRPIDEARGQHLLLGGPAFALEEAAGNLAGGEGLFLVVHGQREEVDARLRLFLAHGGAEHDGLAVAGKHCAIGLTRDTARFQGELAPTPVDFLTMYIEHFSWFRSV